MHHKNHRVILTILYGLSFFFPVHLLWFYYTPAWYPIQSYLFNIPVIVVFLVPTFLPKQIAKPWLIFTYFASIMSSIPSGMYMLFYQTTISSHSFFSLFATSVDEATEFILSQLNFFSIVYFAILTFLPLWPLSLLLRMRFTFGKLEKICFVVGSTFIIILCLIFGPARLIQDHQGCIMIKSLFNYYDVTRSLADYMKKSHNLVVTDVSDELNNLPRTIVVVIGESSNRHHWSLYGYPRHTTPRLEALKSELLVFTDAISPFASTMASVPYALSYINSSTEKMIPLISAFKQVGFETIWISNQSTVDTFNPIVQMVFAADQQHYLNKGGNQKYSRAFDENLVTSFKDVVEIPAKTNKRIIFLHMMGSHVSYASRTPEEFKKFTSEDDIPLRPWRNYNDLSYINDYDNTILYTDSVLADLISEIKNIPNSCLLYFSDHGEEVFDTLPQYGHENRLNSRHFLDIPFFMWLSPGYRNALPAEFVDRLEKAQATPFMNDVAGNIIAELAGISIPSTENDTRNPISPLFTPFERMPYGVNYDRVFNGTKGIDEPVQIQ